MTTKKPIMFWKSVPAKNTGGWGFGKELYEYSFYLDEDTAKKDKYASNSKMSFKLFGYPTCCGMNILHDYHCSTTLDDQLINNTLRAFIKDESKNWSGVIQYNTVYDRVNGGYGHKFGPSKKEPKYHKLLNALKSVTRAKLCDTFYNTATSFHKMELYQFKNPSHKRIKYDKE